MTVAGREVVLSVLELRLLAVLLAADGRVLSRDQLLDAIYGLGEADVTDRAVDVYVKRLREKLGDDPAAPRFVATVRGAGYRAAGPVERRGRAMRRARGRASGPGCRCVAGRRRDRGRGRGGRGPSRRRRVVRGADDGRRRFGRSRPGDVRRERHGRVRDRAWSARPLRSSSPIVFAARSPGPIEHVAGAAGRIADGDLTVRVPEDGPTEVRALAAAYNAMAERLDEQEMMRREFVVNASHELRTPLTNLQGYLEALRDGVLPPEPATFDSLREEVDRLTRLAASLDVLAGGEGVRPPPGPVDLAPDRPGRGRPRRSRPRPSLGRPGRGGRESGWSCTAVRTSWRRSWATCSRTRSATRPRAVACASRPPGARRGPRPGLQHGAGHPDRRPAARLGALLPGREVARPRARRGRHRPGDREAAGRGGRRPGRGRLDEAGWTTFWFRLPA